MWFRPIGQVLTRALVGEEQVLADLRGPAPKPWSAWIRTNEACCLPFRLVVGVLVVVVAF